MMFKSIAVVGATGMLGDPVARAFADAGFPVRIISRDAVKADLQFRGEGFEIVEADIFDKQSLKQAFTGVDGVHINLSGHSPESYLKNHVEGTRNILEAVDRSSIKLISMISSATSYPENAFRVDTKAKLEAEELIKSSGIPYVTYLPSWFYETLALLVNEGTVNTMCDSTKQLRWLSAEDYSRAVVQSYMDSNLHNKRLTLQGPEAYSISQAADIYAEFKGLKRFHMSESEAWAYAKDLGDEALLDAVDLLAYTEKVGEVPQFDTLSHDLECNTRLSDWLELNSSK